MTEAWTVPIMMAEKGGSVSPMTCIITVHHQSCNICPETSRIFPQHQNRDKCKWNRGWCEIFHWVYLPCNKIKENAQQNKKFTRSPQSKYIYSNKHHNELNKSDMLLH